MPATLRAANLLGLGTTQRGQNLKKGDQLKFLLNNVAPATIQPDEAEQFIEFLVDQSVLLGESRVQPMDTNEMDFRFLDMPPGIMRQAVCSTDACTESVTITNTNKCLRTVSLDVKFFLCDDDLQDNITGAQLENLLMRMATDQTSNELEMWALMANTNGSYQTNAATSPTVVNNVVMGLRDTWYRQLQQGNIVDAGTVGAGQGGVQRALDFAKLNCLVTSIPTQYRGNMAAMRIYMPSNMKDRDWVALHQGRQTDLGDTAYLGATPQRHGETPIVGVPMMPTDIQECGCASLPSASGAFMFITDPNNLVWGIQKDITFERQREACQHLTWLIWTVRVDALVFNEDATAIMDCMQVSTCDQTCAPDALANRCNACIDTGSGGEPTP